MKPFGVRRLFRFPSRDRDDVRHDVREEFAFHLDMRVADLVKTGMTRADAHAQALREFGDVGAGTRAASQQSDAVERRRWLGRAASELKQDTAYGLRLIARGPGFSAVAILTLALAIGANTAIFSLVNALFFKPSQLAHPSQLARIRPGESTMSWLNIEDIRRRNAVFSDVIAQRFVQYAFQDDSRVVRLNGSVVTPDYFTTLGVAARAGRPFLPADTRRDVVVLSERAWRTEFGQDPRMIGSRITLDGRSYEVIGIMPPKFRGLTPPGLGRDFWVPIDTTVSAPWTHDRGATPFEVYGRLRAGVTFEQATASMKVLGSQLKAEFPRENDRFDGMEVFPADGIGAFRGVARTLAPVLAFIALLTIVAGFVLLIACANIAGLLLGRAAARRREIALRLAVGAGRARLIRQFLTESLLLAVAGGIAGVCVSVWLTALLQRSMTRLPIPTELDFTLDVRVLAYALALSSATVMLFGFAPARRAARTDLISALKDDAGTGRQRHRQTLVVSQVAICSLLLVWGSLFARSLGNAARLNPGFNPHGVLIAEVAPSESVSPDPAAIERLFVDLQDRTAKIPGVESAGMAFNVPLAFMGRSEFSVRVAGDSAQDDRRRVMANNVTPGYFKTIGVPFVAGRDITWGDRTGTPAVVIVNETAARRFWNGNALGRALTIPARDTDGIEVEVIGVVADSKYWTIGETIEPTLYLPVRQQFVGTMTLFARTTSARATAEAIRIEAKRLAPGLSVDVKPMSDAIGVALLPARVGALFTGAFGFVAMALSAIGIYGLVAFTVAQRAREIGVRKAIGATEADIARLIIGETLRRILLGLALGIALGSAAATVLSGFVVGVSPIDPLTMAIVFVVVTCAALAACAAPAVRAARVDPLVTLRAE